MGNGDFVAFHDDLMWSFFPQKNIAPFVSFLFHPPYYVIPLIYFCCWENKSKVVVTDPIYPI